MRHLTKAAALLGILALAASPVLAGGPNCGAKASGASCGAKATQASAGSCGSELQASACGFMSILKAAGGDAGCCASQSAFKSLKVDLVQTTDGYMAVATVEPAQVKAIQGVVNGGWEQLVTTDSGCTLCDEMRAFAKSGATVEIYNTSNGAIVVARANEKSVVDGLHAFVTRMQTPAETQS